MDDKVSKRRANNKKSQQTYRWRKSLGYQPQSNGRPGRPPLPGTWPQGEPLLDLGQPHESLPVHSGDGLTVDEEDAPQVVQFSPGEYSSVRANEQNTPPGEEHNTLDTLAGIFDGQTTIENEHRECMEEYYPCHEEGMPDKHNVCTTPPMDDQRCHYEAHGLRGLPQPSLFPAGPAPFNIWTRPEDVCGYEAFHPNAGHAEAYRAKPRRSISSPGATNYVTTSHHGPPTPPYSSFEHSCRPALQHSQCCSSITDANEDYHRRAMMLSSPFQVPANFPVAVIYVPVKFQSQTCRSRGPHLPSASLGSFPAYWLLVTPTKQSSNSHIGAFDACQDNGTPIIVDPCNEAMVTLFVDVLCSNDSAGEMIHAKF
ncbi:hypothetical protein GQ44DRAFT_734007 [Phaeosphaeriaceae sp. PMI808]|nr:hypothetical protein GQ44DRAFT_734007 [Phaeosphaeriaceae sp. PMI808]